MVLRGVEVDVVGHLERQLQDDLGPRQQVCLDQGAVRLVGEQLDQPRAHGRPDRPAGCQEGVQGRGSEDGSALELVGAGEGREVDHLVAQGDADPGGRPPVAEDAERQVRGREG